MIWSRFAAFWMIACLFWPTDGAARAETCTMDRLLSDYRKASESYGAKEFAEAFKAWQDLADIGFAPAQRKLALMYANGHGTQQSLTDGAFWAGIAATYGGDANGYAVKRQIDDKLTAEQKMAVDRRMKTWTPKKDACWRNIPAKGHRDGLYKLSFDDGLVVRIEDDIPGDMAEALIPRMEILLRQARQATRSSGIYLGIIDQIRIRKSDRYDRFVGWQDAPEDTLIVSIGNFLDDSPGFAANAIILAAGRRTYEKLPGSHFADRFVREKQGRRLVGSVYPDIDNKLFFAMLEKTLAHSGKLPKKLRKNVEAIDEIRYMPHSKHFKKFGTVDSMAAYYDPSLSSPTNRIILIRRDLRWSSEFGLLLTLVHEGTHILQDARGDLEHGPHAIRFECEATENEILAAQALDLPPSLVEDTQYLQVCEKAQIMVNKWKDRRLFGK